MILKHGLPNYSISRKPLLKRMAYIITKYYAVIVARLVHGPGVNADTKSEFDYYRDGPDQLYHCFFCEKYIGDRSAIPWGDKLNRVFCGPDCRFKESVSLRSEYNDIRQLYHCNRCGKYIGKWKKVYGEDKYDRVYCSEKCYHESMFHPSRDYEARGGDY